MQLRLLLALLGALLLAQDAKVAKKPGLPLAPERKIEFDTDEGTWLSLSASPDGRTILFDMLGDLYTIPMEGGEAKRITSGLPFDSQPIYSPDGQWIAFTSDRDGAENLWIAKADGSEPKQLSRDKESEFASPSWTPDGCGVFWVFFMKPCSSTMQPCSTQTRTRRDRGNAAGQGETID